MDVTDPGSRGAPGATQRCPACGKLNRVPAHDSGKARCGACKALLGAAPAPGAAPPRAGDLGRLVIERWDALVRLVPRGAALGRATGRDETDDPAADPVGWLSAAAHIPKDDLDQVRLLRIHLASKKTLPQNVITRALDTLDRAHAVLDPTHLPT